MLFDECQVPVVQKVDNSIRWINHYPVDSVVCFVNTYPLDSDLSGGQRYPAFEQLGPDLLTNYNGSKPYATSLSLIGDICLILKLTALEM